MSDKNKSDGKIIEGHEYDGIQELDHPLPRWWVYLFYSTIVFAVVYYSYYEFLGGPTHKEQYEAAMAKIELKAKSNAPAAIDFTQIDPTSLMSDPEAMKVGAATFGQFCTACHGSQGEGGIGPNLTDNFWMHSKGGFKGIIAAIQEGFPAKGMPPWKSVIAQEKQAPLAAYVLKLKGTNPPNPKAPQGEAVE